MRNVDVAIIGAGHAGLNAVKEVKKVTDNWVLINGGDLGTTCARVGCMPSKALIELTSRSGRAMSGDPSIEDILERTRDLRDIFVDLVLANSTDEMVEGEQLISGYPTFVSPDTLSINDQLIRAKRIIIATGSSPIVPQNWAGLGDRLMTSNSLFDLENLPDSIGVIGLGLVGLEMGQAFHRLGRRVVGFNTGDEIGAVVDPVIAREAKAILSREFPIHAGQPAEVYPVENGVQIRAGDNVETVDKVFVAVGRRPNLPAGLERFTRIDANGVWAFDPATLRVDGLPVYLAGDVNGSRMMLQDAAEEGKLAGRNAVAARDKPGDPRVYMSITFTDPNICQVGARLDELSDPVIGEQRFGPNGRALAMGSNRGLIRIYAEPGTGRLLGAAMVGPRVEHLAHLTAWAIQLEMSIQDMVAMPFYHPVVEEALQDVLKHTLPKVQASRPAVKPDLALSIG